MIAKPVSFKQSKRSLWIEDANGVRIAGQDRHAWSSKDETLEDTIQCLNFPREGRNDAASANASQIEAFEQIAEAINGFRP